MHTGAFFLWIFCLATLYLHIFEHGKIAILFTEKFIGLASAYCIAANQEEEKWTVLSSFP